MRRIMSAVAVAMLLSTAAHAMEQPQFSGTAYFDYLWIAQGFDDQDSTAFQFRRIYFTYDQVLSPEVSWRFRLESENADVTSKGRLAPFVKHAYVKWSDALLHGTLYAGLAATPHFETSERLWGYRSIEKVQMDYRGVASTTDMGAALAGGFGPSHHVEYHVMVANGNGTRPENNVEKRAYATLRMLPGAAVFEVSGDYEGRPGRSDVFLARTLLGIEHSSSAGMIEFYYRTERGATSADPDLNSLGASATLRGEFSEKLGGFARADYFNPSVDERGDTYHEGLVIAGLDWRPSAADVHIVPNVEIALYDAPRMALERDADILARITLVANIK